MKSKKSRNKPNRTLKPKSRKGKGKGNKRVAKRKQKVSKRKPLKKERQIVIRRSSGRMEKFDTNRMAQTVGRSGVPFLMARDVAKKVSNKLKQESYTPHTKRRKNNKLKPIQPKEKTVTASRVRKLVANELRDRNRSDIAASYSGQVPENTLQEQSLKDKQPVADNVAVNKNRVLHDTSKRGGGIY
jgi:vancomycin resistance protein YoaR